MITCMEASDRVILEPGHPSWDAARRAFDLAVGPLPAAAIEVQLALVAAALAPYGAVPAHLGG